MFDAFFEVPDFDPMELTMNRPTYAHARLGTLAVIPLALIVSGIVVSTASYSAFSATSSDGSSNWEMGTVALDNDANQALFAAENLKPGAMESKCLVVTSTGSLPSAVKLYASDVQQTQQVASWVTLQVREGSGGGNGSCDGFAAAPGTLYDGTLAGFVGGNVDYASGIGGWETTGQAAESRTYQISYTVSPEAPASIMGATATLGFTWEAQNL